MSTFDPKPADGRRSVQPEQIRWALYDWANSGFAVVVLTALFPVMYKEVWNQGVPATESTFRLGMTNAVATLVVVSAAPLIGALADRWAAKKRLLGLFLMMGVGACIGLALADAGSWWAASCLFVVGYLGFAGGNICYDALLVDVARPAEYDRVSALGYAFGYLGGGLLFAFDLVLIAKPQWFGVGSADAATRLAFASVALWWGLFAVPLFLRVREAAPLPVRATVGVFGQLADTLRDLRARPEVWVFLLAYWLYIDGVDTVIRMAVDYGMALGLASQDLVLAILITQFVAFPAALGFIVLARVLGTRGGLFLGLGVYLAVTLWGYVLDSATEFYLLAAVVGLVQGGVQALSRSLYARLIPEERAAEYFGLYNMLGKFAAVIGPALVGAVAMYSGDSRLGMLALLLLFVPGMLLLARVRLDPAGR
ncbi:MAG: MFS transporter [Pseudomonadota bacterium]|nr:MFS transporter [Pseudomonadota bacterium]